MAGEHVGEESDGQGHRFHQGAENLDDRHDGLQEQRDVRIENFLVIVPGSGQVHREEGAQGQHQGDGDVARQVRPAREERQDAHEIVQQDEQEGHAQVGGILAVIFLADVLAGHVVDHHHERFHQGSNTRRRLIQHVVFLIPPGCAKDDDKQQEAGYHQRKHVLGDGDVEGALPAVYLHDLPLFRVDHQAFIGFPVLQMLGREHMPACGTMYDDRQMQDHVLVAPGEDMPLVFIADMLEDNSGDVHFLLLLRFLRFARNDRVRVIPNLRSR